MPKNMKLETHGVLPIVFLFALFVWVVNGIHGTGAAHVFWLVLLFSAGLFLLLRYEQTTLILSASVLIWALGLAGGYLVFAKTHMSGLFDYTLATIAGLSVVLAGYLLYTEHNSIARPHLPATKWTVLGCSIVIIAGMLLALLIDLTVLRVLFGALYALFLPGFLLSYAFTGEKELEVPERIALSIALSVAAVSILVFYLQVAGVTISLLTIFLAVLLICIAASIIALRKEVFRRHAA